MRSKKTNIATGCVHTLQELSLAAGVSRRTVSDWVKLPGFPREDDGSISIWKVAKWLHAREKENETKRSGHNNGSDSRAELEREKLQLENDDRRLKIQQRAGRLVSLEGAMRYIRQMFTTLKARLDSIPNECTTAVPPECRAEVIADMRQRINLALRELSAQGENYGNGHGHSI